jgi:hypothetical protein
VIEPDQTHNQHGACPFARPFPLGFDKCPDYRPILYVSAHAAYSEMMEVLTCQHLQVGTTGLGRYYPQCRVGAPTRRSEVSR